MINDPNDIFKLDMTHAKLSGEDNQPQSVSGGSDTPRTDSMIASVQGGMFADKSDGITPEEDYYDKSKNLCRQLERENQQLQFRAEQMDDKLAQETTKNINLVGDIKDLQSKLRQAEQACELRQKQVQDEITRYAQLCDSKAQLEQQNAALKNALEKLTRKIESWRLGSVNASDVLLSALETQHVLSIPPTTQDWVKKEDVRPIVEALKLSKIIPEINPSNYTHDDACELNSKAVEVGLAHDKAVTLATQLGL